MTEVDVPPPAITQKVSEAVDTVLPPSSPPSTSSSSSTTPSHLEESSDSLDDKSSHAVPPEHVVAPVPEDQQEAGEQHDEEEDPSQAAFSQSTPLLKFALLTTDVTLRNTCKDPETGEINWDCPCLGGMAHGPCGEEFKAAFSCFVYSEQEPKGAECIEKFRGMQECFRAHPEVYGASFRPAPLFLGMRLGMKIADEVVSSVDQEKKM